MKEDYINWIVKGSEKITILKNRDRLLVNFLTTNSRASLTEIGKAMKLSKVAVFNRIKNLESKGIILGYSTFINFSKLGFKTYQIGIKTSMTLEQKEKYLDEINKFPFINQILKLTKGKWDFLVRIISNEDLILDQIKKLSNENIQEMDIIESLKVVYYNEKEVKITDIDKIIKPSLNKKQLKLLFELSKNSRESIVNLSSKTSLSTKTIMNNIKLLKKNGIIISFITEFNPFIYGNECYLIVIKTKKRNSDENLIKNLVKLKSTGAFINLQNPSIISFHVISSLDDLKEIEKSLKPYLNDISSYEFIKVEEQTKYNLFPESIYQYLSKKI